MKIFARFAKDESGATAIEYGLIAALIAVGIIVAATFLGDSLSDMFAGIGNQLADAAESGGDNAWNTDMTTDP